MRSKRAPPSEGEGRATLPDLAIEVEEIGKIVRGIHFCEVRVIILDGVVVRIERIEKQRPR